MKTRNYYEILNIKEDANLIEIKTNYHKLARKYHPDITKEKLSTHDAFIEINEAYRTLKDPILRKAYDFGLRQKRDNGRTVSSNTSYNNNSTPQQTQAENVVDMQQFVIFRDKAFALFKNGNYNEALYNIDSAIKFNADAYEIWEMRGDIYKMSKNFDLAMESYSKACQLNNSNDLKVKLADVIAQRSKEASNSSNSSKKKGFFHKLFN